MPIHRGKQATKREIMQATTLNTLDRVLNEQGGFLTAMDLGLLLRDPTMHPVLLLLRLHASPRKTVPMVDAPAAIEAVGDDLRDVCFPSPEHRDLARTVERRKSKS